MDKLNIKMAYVSPKIMRLSIREGIEARGDGSAVSDYGCEPGGSAKGDPLIGCNDGAIVSGGTGLNSDCTTGALASEGSCSAGTVPGLWQS